MEKQALRERVWDELEEEGVARFPFPPHDRIPNFAGAADAADHLTATDSWGAATVLKANPDAPQLPVRRAALNAGKTVYVPVPRLRERDCFYRLDPAKIEDVEAATTVSGIGDAGEQVGPTELEHVDMVISGSVAVDVDGNRVGKGEGYSDLEFGILSETGAITRDTTTVTTVHARQVRDEAWSIDEFDVPMERVVTPDGVMTTGVDATPTGIDWSALNDDKQDAIPILAEFEPE